MRILRIVLIALLALAALVVAAGLFLPRTVHVERSVFIDAPPARIYEVVSNMRRFNEWSPWFERDPSALYEYSGAGQGVGSKMSWTSERPEVGSGSQEIVVAEPLQSITTRLDFGPQGQANATIEIEPEGAGSQVTWSFDANFEDDYFGRYFGVMMDNLLGPDYEQGLANLKRVVERGRD